MYPIGGGLFGRRIKNVVKMWSKWKGPQKMQVKLHLSMFGRVLVLGVALDCFGLLWAALGCFIGAK